MSIGSDAIRPLHGLLDNGIEEWREPRQGGGTTGRKKTMAKKGERR
jgi:hypothetical protein